MRTYGITFASLWDGSNAVRSHYGSPYTSNFWLLDKSGERVGARPRPFNVNSVERMLSDLEASSDSGSPE